MVSKSLSALQYIYLGILISNHRFSATNAWHHYKLALANLEENYLSGWPLTDSLNTGQIWDGIVILALLKDHMSQGTLLQVPHTGMQVERFKEAI